MELSKVFVPYLVTTSTKDGISIGQLVTDGKIEGAYVGRYREVACLDTISGRQRIWLKDMRGI